MASLSPISDPKRARRGFTLLELMIAMSLLAFLTLGVMSTYLFVGRNLERLMSTQQQGVKARRLIRQFTQDASSALSIASTSGPALSSSYLEFTVPTPLALANCTTTLASQTVTCTSTTGLAATHALTGSGVPNGTVVSSVTDGTTFVMSIKATATASGLTINAVVPVTVKYTYSSANATLVRNYNGVDNPTLPLLSNIDTTVVSPVNGFAFYNQEGVTVSPSSPFLKQVEFAFTTASGNAAIGLRTSYTIVSPRVILRNKPILQ